MSTRNGYRGGRIRRRLAHPARQSQIGLAYPTGAHELVGCFQPGDLFVNHEGVRRRIPCSPSSSLAPSSSDLGMVTDDAPGIQKRSDGTTPAGHKYIHRLGYRLVVPVRSYCTADSSRLGCNLVTLKARSNPIDSIVCSGAGASCGLTHDSIINIDDRHINERLCVHSRWNRVHAVLRQSSPRYRLYRGWCVCAI